MSVPIAIFDYSPNGLAVTFKDYSSGNPSSWSWDFGDGGTHTSQNPIHTYATPGWYFVTLTATNGDGASTPISLQIGVGNSGEFLPLPQRLFEMVDNYLPDTVNYDVQTKVTQIKSRQIYIHPLVNHNIADEDIYNELAYHPLENILVAQLVALDMILAGANAYLSSLSPKNGSQGRQIKSMVEGPAEAEWFDNSDAWGSIMKPGGLFESLKTQVCGSAARVEVFLPWCPALAHNPIMPIKVTKPETTVPTTWPYKFDV